MKLFSSILISGSLIVYSFTSFNSYGSEFNNKTFRFNQINLNKKYILSFTEEPLLNKYFETKPLEIEDINISLKYLPNNSYTSNCFLAIDNKFAELNSKFVEPTKTNFKTSPLKFTDKQPECDTIKINLRKSDYVKRIQNGINDNERFIILIDNKNYIFENPTYSSELNTLCGNLILKTQTALIPGVNEIKIQKYKIINSNRVEFNISNIQRYRISVIKIKDKVLSTNSVYFDFGLGLFEGSLNYAWQIRTTDKRDWYFRTGIGGAIFPFFWGGPGGIFGFTMLTKGYRNHHFELNMGAIIGYNVEEEEFFEFPIFGYPLFDIGYRYQKPKTAGLFFKAKIGLGFGLGVGYAFN